MSLFPFLATVAWLVFINWVVGWRRRQKAIHRKRFLAGGLKENNPGRRLRGDMYIRIAAIVYFAVGFLAYLWVGAMIPRYAAMGAHIIFPVLASIFVPLPAVGFAYFFAMTRGEAIHPQGDLALQMLKLEFHKPGQPIVPDGEYGTAPVLDARREGLVERLFAPRPQPIVEQEAK